MNCSVLISAHKIIDGLSLFFLLLLRFFCLCFISIIYTSFVVSLVFDIILGCGRLVLMNIYCMGLTCIGPLLIPCYSHVVGNLITIPIPITTF